MSITRFSQRLPLLIATLLLTKTTGLHGAPSVTSDISGPDPVSVSAANYRKTERYTMLRAVEGANSLNPPAPSFSHKETPERFIFVAGETYTADISFQQVCALLAPALAEKGYINAADDKGRIFEPESVQLVLRVHYGMRPWRRPSVRSSQLTWDDGLDPILVGPGLTKLGGDQVWSDRAGGNDDAINAAAVNATRGAFSFGGGGGRGPSTGAPSAPTPTAAVDPLTEYEGTRDFQLIVVDAFDYKELKSKGKRAQRLWTTFLAAPAKPDEPFSRIAQTLIRNGKAFFGETSEGLQIYTDARAEVHVGPVEVMK